MGSIKNFRGLGLWITVFIGAAASYLVIEPQTTVDLPERNLRIVYQTQKTNNNRKCPDHENYIFLVEKERNPDFFGPDKLLATYLDCGPNLKVTEYKNFYDCLIVTERGIKPLNSGQCDHQSDPSKFNLGRLISEANEQYNGLRAEIEKIGHTN